MKKHIASAININEVNRGNSHAAGQAKVIVTQSQLVFDFGLIESWPLVDTLLRHFAVWKAF